MPEPDFLRTTREFYDAVATDYADHFRDEPATQPLDRVLLAGFAERVETTQQAHLLARKDETVDGGPGPVARPPDGGAGHRARARGGPGDQCGGRVPRRRRETRNRP